jgi:radical SAM superfamily enzyme YgiQ (UPF0313 family)
MKIALISTDGDYWGFGIRVLSSALRRAGHSPTMIFLTQDAQRYPEHVLEELSALVQSADLIGISCHSQGARRAAQAAAHLRRLRKPMVWGGVHASLNPAECATSVDAVCIGEGEETIVELADMIGSGQTWERVRNLTYLRAGHIVTNPLRPPSIISTRCRPSILSGTPNSMSVAAAS